MSDHATLADAAKVRTVFDDRESAGARTYAEALLAAARKQNQVDTVVGELEEFLRDVFDGQPQVAELLTSPAVGAEQKDRLLVGMTEGRATPTLIQFLRVVNRNDRLALLPTIGREAAAIRDRMLNRRPVMVRSAEALTGEQLTELSRKIAHLIGGEPVIQVVVDPSLIGGLIIQAGDEVYDLSVRSRLQQMRRRIVEEKVHEIRGRLSQAVTA